MKQQKQLGDYSALADALKMAYNSNPKAPSPLNNSNSNSINNQANNNNQINIRSTYKS
jgi:hypothetical protein